jgi:rubrerythrin
MNKNSFENMVRNCVFALRKLNEETEYYEDNKYYKVKPKESAAIENALKSECDAIEIYYNLMSSITDKKDRMTIQEIISDEENHKYLLEDMLKKYSKIPMAKD